MLDVVAYPGTIAGRLGRRLYPATTFLLNVCILLFVSSPVVAQTASLRGQVVDQSGAFVPKARVTVATPSGLARTTTTTENGSYSFAGLLPGHYSVEAAAPKLQQQPVQIVLKSGTQTLRLELKVAAMQQQTTVQENTNTSLSTESANNASALVLTGKDLESIRFRGHRGRNKTESASLPV